MTKNTNHAFFGEGEDFAKIWSEAQIKSFHENLTAAFEKSDVKRPKDDGFAFRPSVYHDGEIEIFYVDNHLPIAFDDGMVLTQNCNALDDYVIAQIVSGIRTLENDSAKIIRNAKLVQKYLSTEFQGYGVSRYEITPYGFHMPEPYSAKAKVTDQLELTFVIDIELLDNTARMRGMSFLYTAPVEMTEWRIPPILKDHLENQEKRANTGYKGEIMIDSVSAAFLKRTMLPEDLKLFVDLMVAQETPAHAELDHNSITDKVNLPERMIDARIINGRIITRTAIDEDVYLISDRIEIIGKNVDPEALKDAIGKPVTDIIKSNFFTSKVIVKAIDTAESSSVFSDDVISLLVDLPLVKLTSLVPTKRLSVSREKTRTKVQMMREKMREKA